MSDVEERTRIFGGLMTPGSYEGKVAVAVIETLAEKMDSAGVGLMTGEGVSEWLRECKKAIKGLT